MSKDLEILIKAKLDEELSESIIKNQLNKISKKLEIGITTDSKVLNKMQQEINRLQKEIQKNSKGITLIDGKSFLDQTENLKEGIKNTYTTFSEAERVFKSLGAKITPNIDVKTNEVKSFIAEFQTMAGVIEKLKYEMKDGNIFELTNRKRIDDSVKAAEQQIQKIHKINQDIEKRSLKEREKVLIEEQKIRRAIEQRNKLEEENIKKLKEQIELRQRQARVNVRNLERQYSGKIPLETQKALQDYLRSYEKLNVLTPEVQSKMRSLDMTFKELASTVRTAGNKSVGFVEQLSIALNRIPIWMIGMTAFYAPLRAFRDAISQIIELDSQLTVLKRVSNGQIEINDALKESINLAYQLGNVINEVNEGLINYARQGFRGEDLAMMTEYATLMANISDLSVDEAASVLTAAIKGFRLETEQALHVVNAMNEVDNNYSVTTQQLAEALMKSAGAAQTYGVSLEKNIGYTTAIAQVTRESGSIIGNSLKTIYSRITSINKAVELLESIGISVRDSAGEMRPVEDILDDLSAKWDSLSNEMKQNLGLQIAGRHQLSRFLILLDQYSEAQKATETAINSAGSAYRENQEYLQSYEARLNRVKNAWTEAIIEMRDSILGAGFETFTDVSTSIIKSFSEIVKHIGILPVVLSSGATMFALFNKNLRDLTLENGKSFLEWLKNLPTSLNLVKNSATSAGMQIRFLGSSALTTAFSIKSLSTALMTLTRFLAGMFLPVAAFMSLGYAITWVTNKISEHKKEQEKIKNEAKNLADTYNLHKDRIHQLVDSYDKLSNQVSKGEISKDDKEYLTVQQELYELLPHLAERVDEKGQAHLRSADAVKKEIEYLKELSQLENQKFIDNFIDNIQDINEKISETEQKIRNIKHEMSSQDDTAFSISLPKAKLSSEDLIAESVYLREIEVYLDKQIQNYIELGRRYAELMGSKGKLIEQDEKYISDLIRQNQEMLKTEEGIESLKASVQQYAVIAATVRAVSGDLFNSDEIRRLSNEQIKALQNLENALANGETNWDSYRGALSKLFTAEQVETIINHLKNAVKNSGLAAQEGAVYFREFGDELDNSSESIEEYASELDKLTVNLQKLINSKQINNAIDLFSSDLYSEVADKVAIYNELLEKLSQGKQISAHEAMELIAKEKQLADAITIENGIIKINTELVKTNRDNYIKAYKDKGKAIQTELNAEKTAVLSKLKLYGIELQAIKSVAEARKQAIEQYKQRYKGMENEMWYTRGLSQIVNEVNTSLAPILEAEEKLNSLMKLAESGLKSVGTELEKTSNKSSKSAKSAKKAAKDTEYATYISDQYKLALEKLNAQIERLQSAQSKYSKHSKQYRDAIKQEINLLKQKQQLLQAQAKDLEQQIKSGRIIQTGVVTTRTSSSGSAYTGKYAKEINQAAKKYGVDPFLIAAIIKHESGFNPRAVSRAGAQGLMQLMPATARALGVKNPFDPLQNIMGGTKYIAQQLKAFGGDLRLALAAYNAGPGNVRKYGGVPPFKETQNYVKKVLSTYGSGSGKATVNVSKEIAQNAADIDQAKLDLLNLQQEIFRINDLIESKYLEIIESHLEEFDYKRRKLEKDLSRLDYYQTLYDENTVQWAKYQAQREKILNQQRKIHEDSIKFLQKEIKTNKNLTKAQKQRLDEELLERQKELWSLEKQILDERVKMAERILDVYRKTLEAQRDAALKAIDRLLDEIDERERESDFRKRLEKQQKSAQEIRDLISQWAMVDSDLARKRIKELTEQLQEIEEEIDEMLHDKSIEERKRALEKEREAINERYDNLLNDEQKFAKMRSDIIKGNTKEIQGILDSFYKQVKNMTNELGKSVVANLQNAIKQVNAYIQSPNYKNVKLQHFDTGGMVKVGSTKGGLAVVHDKEIVLNRNDSKNFLDAIKESKDLLSMLKLPTMPRLATATTNNMGDTLYFDISFNVDRLEGTVDGVKSAFNEIFRGLQSKGININRLQFR